MFDMIEEKRREIEERRREEEYLRPGLCFMCCIHGTLGSEKFAQTEARN